MHNNNKYSFNFISIQPYVHFIFLGLMLVFFPLTASATSCDDFKTLSYTSNEQVKEKTVTSEDEDFCIHQVVPDSITQGSGYELANCKVITWNELSDCLTGKGYTVGFEAAHCPQ